MATTVGTPSGLRIREWTSPLAIAVVLYAISQQWSGLDTPDSEFYASLSIFTHQITDRAPFDGYFWTRLGMIAPAHAAISLLGIWEGFAAYKALLMLIFTSSLFAIVRRFTGFWRTTWLTAAASCSSILVAYLGNPYVSATVVAGLMLSMAAALRDGPVAAVGTGFALGWLSMTYPTGALLGTTICLSIFIYRLRTAHPGWELVMRTLVISGAALVATLGIFWLAGRYLFPGLDWWQTFVQASGQDHSVHGSGQWVWLRDISLLVPASTLVVAIFNRLRARGKQPADLALIISSSSVAFYLVFAPIFGAQFLEAPLHQVLIWAPTLTAIVLVATSRMPDSPSRNPTLIALTGFALSAILVSGSVAPDFGFVLGMVIAIGTTAVLLTAPQRTISTLLAVALFLLGAQLLQNSRPQLGNFMLDPYYWAYTGNPNEAKLRAAVNAQRWLIDNTVREDRLLLWVDGPWREGDRELYSVAAMQLWGENRVTLESTLTDDYGLEKTKVVRPTALVLYGKSMDAVWAFWNSVPKQLDPSPPKCYDFTWPDDPTSAFPTAVGHTCIVRLTKEP